MGGRVKEKSSAAEARVVQISNLVLLPLLACLTFAPSIWPSVALIEEKSLKIF